MIEIGIFVGCSLGCFAGNMISAAHFRTGMAKAIEVSLLQGLALAIACAAHILPVTTCPAP